MDQSDCKMYLAKKFELLVSEGIQDDSLQSASP